MRRSFMIYHFVNMGGYSFHVLYALPAWGVFASVGQSGRIDAFLKRAYKFGFSKDIIIINELLTKSGSSLFLKMQSSVHCLSYLLPLKKDHVLQT